MFIGKSIVNNCLKFYLYFMQKIYVVSIAESRSKTSIFINLKRGPVGDFDRNENICI